MYSRSISPGPPFPERTDDCRAQFSIRHPIGSALFNATCLDGLRTGGAHPHERCGTPEFPGPAHRGAAGNLESVGGFRQQRHGQGQRIPLHVAGPPGQASADRAPAGGGRTGALRGRTHLESGAAGEHQRSAMVRRSTPTTSSPATGPSWTRRARRRSQERSPTLKASRPWTDTPSSSGCTNPRSPSRRHCSSASRPPNRSRSTSSSRNRR